MITTAEHDLLRAIVKAISDLSHDGTLLPADMAAISSLLGAVEAQPLPQAQDP